MSEMGWYQPKTLDEALSILDEKHPKIVCGGTDLFVNWPVRKKDSQVENWLDIGRLPDLKSITQTDDHIEIGAAVTASEIWDCEALQGLAALQKAAKVIGGWQIQNRASIGGNIANASPAADLIVPLIAYEASVIIRSRSNNRTVPVVDVITGPKATSIAENEMITAIIIPKEAVDIPQTFIRLDQRGGTDISIVSVAAIVNGPKENVSDLKIAVGAASPKPVILSNLQNFIGGEMTEDKLNRLCDLYAENCQPITDVRASAEYRKAMVKVFIKRAISELLSDGTEV